MRVVVTGASGNVGSAVVRRLTSSGEHEVVGVVRRPPEEPGVEWVAADLSDDACLPVLEQAFTGADAVVHLVWGFQPSHRQSYLESLGVDGTRRVLAAVRTAGVAHVVHMSSVGVYSPKADDEPVDEDYPRDGIATSWYGRSKAAAERLLDRYEAEGGAALVTRLRPGIIGQRTAGSALLRYGVPGFVPAAALGLVPVLPLDRDLRIPMVHSDDVAAAVEQVLVRRAGGPFNLAAEPAVTRADVAEALGARPVHVPAAVLRLVASAAWHARIQPVDPGWLDLAFGLPLLDSTRARVELDWSPTVTAPAVLAEVLDGMRHTRHGDTAVLRRRTLVSTAGDALRHGPVGVRRLP